MISGQSCSDELSGAHPFFPVSIFLANPVPQNLIDLSRNIHVLDGVMPQHGDAAPSESPALTKDFVGQIRTGPSGSSGRVNQAAIHDGERNFQKVVRLFPCEIIRRKGKTGAISESNLVGKSESRVIRQARAFNLSEQFEVTIETKPMLAISQRRMV